MVSFGEYIRTSRKKKKLTQKKLASFLNISPKYLSKIERGEKQPTSQLIEPLCQYLNLDFKKMQIQYLSEKLAHILQDEAWELEALTEATHIIKYRKSLGFKGKEELIRSIANYFKNSSYPIEKAWLFGSYARGEETPQSDVDILIRLIRPSQFSLFDYGEMLTDLKEITGLEVDLIEEQGLKANIKSYINQDKTIIYEATNKGQPKAKAYS